MEEVNYEALRLKVEVQLQNLAETSNQQVNVLNLCLSDEFLLSIKEKLEDTSETLEVLETQIGRLGLKEHFYSVKLKRSLKDKKFLIVLDDIWDDNYNEWDDLSNLFVQGEIGSKIIVTTCKESVVLMMGCGAINLGTLFDEVSWAVFKRHSLENRDPKEHPELEEVGKQIAHGCKGLPLALKALSSLLLSYSDLPAPLKQCFAYCAIFPKDLFCNVQVIHLWIANGLVQQFHSGNQYFLDLRSRSLFEWVPESSKRDIEKFLMHDLVNDFAQMSSSELCISLEENEGSHKLKQSRHMSYSMVEETLLVSSCDDLEELSLQMEKLINLCHLDISNTSRLKTPLSELVEKPACASRRQVSFRWSRREALKANTGEKNLVEKVIVGVEWKYCRQFTN
ncbi:putative disease resistance RPP13-like protein 1-like [Capsicum annuum]|nr:putative disease resistance RPP13-like protein 1-like [Capsicum annuum]